MLLDNVPESLKRFLVELLVLRANAGKKIVNIRLKLTHPFRL